MSKVYQISCMRQHRSYIPENFSSQGTYRETKIVGYQRQPRISNGSKICDKSYKMKP